MTSRERILAAVRRQPLDRVPISTYELCGLNPAAWENNEPSYESLMSVISDRTDCIYYWVESCLSYRPCPIRETVTHAEAHSRFTTTTFHTPTGDLTQVQREDDGVHTVWTTKALLSEIEDIDRYLSIPYELPVADLERVLAEKARIGDRGVMMITICDPICVAAELFGMERFLEHALIEPERVSYLLDVLHERQMAELQRILSPDMRDVMFRICGPEYATPPYLPPEAFARFVTPYLIRMCEQIRAVGAIARVHCHGRIGRVIEEIARAEPDALDPVEPPPDGDISLGEVKRFFGERLCLLGNIELRELEASEPERIEALVKAAMAEAKADGGYILMPTSAPMTVPLDPRIEGNYRALIDAAFAYGRY